jgi:hypothetical protein
VGDSEGDAVGISVVGILVGNIEGADVGQLVGADVGSPVGRRVVFVGANVGADVEGADVGGVGTCVGNDVASPAIFAAAEPKLASSSAANAIVTFLQDALTVPIGM